MPGILWIFWNPAIHNNRYLNKLRVHGGIEINHHQRLEFLLGKPDFEVKLFFLFLMKAYFLAVHKWMNQCVD
jgi:hypothetical protein